MKNFKFFSIFLTLLVALFYLACKESLAPADSVAELEVPVSLRGTDDHGTNPCANDISALDCGQTNHYSTWIRLDDYPDCKLLVEGTWRMWDHDQDPSTFDYQVVFSDVQVVQASIGCQQLYIDALKVLQGGNEVEISEFFNSFYHELFDKVGMAFIQERVGLIPALTQCGQSILNVQTDFYTESCYSICIQEDDPVWSKIACGDGCCRREIEYCLDEEGNLVSTATTNTLSPCQHTFNTNCPPNFSSSGPCILYCE